MTNEKKSLYITYSRAKSEYFLTDSMFREIDPPDLLLDNPHYKRAPKMKLYLIERVESWISENSDRVEKARLRREKLSKAQIEAHRQRKKKMIKLAKSWQPKIFNIPKNVTSDAIHYYYSRYSDFQGNLSFSALVAYIRHNYTDYEEYLDQIDEYRGKTGVGLLYSPLRQKVDSLVQQYIQNSGLKKHKTVKIK